MNKQIPWAYFLTFRTYATYLHGDSRLSIDMKNNVFGKSRMPENIFLHASMKKSCIEEPFILTSTQRSVTLQSIKQTCEYSSWDLFAVHVRTNHVHAVIKSTIDKEKTLSRIKSYATRALRKNDVGLLNRKKFWAVHGSTKLIWHPELALPALYYIIEEQGEPMALYYDEEFYNRFDPESYKAYRKMYD